jgi:glycosyltransferase involved in cell wall biosynthesis
VTVVVYVDITEFIGNPIRTGIQRLVREILSYWPNAGQLVPIVFDPTTRTVRTVSHDAVRYAVGHAGRTEESLEDALAQIAYLDTPADSNPVTLTRGDRVLIPELFFEGNRVQFYRDAVQQGVDIGMVVPDFLVWLRTDTFPIRTTYPLMPYLMLLIEVRKRAFISAAVKRTFEERISRRPGTSLDLALDLGADGMGIAPQTYRSDRTDLLFLGTLDGRKGQDIVYKAFCDRRCGEHLTLTFVGKLPWDYAACLEPLVTNSRDDVRVLSGKSDSEIAALFTNVRASLYPSPAEGYGLPPMESLHAGVPVVVHESLPALEGKPRDGQIRLTSLEHDALRDAIESLADEAFVTSLWDQARSFPSTSWKSVAAQTAAWILT